MRRGLRAAAAAAAAAACGAIWLAPATGSAGGAAPVGPPPPSAAVELVQPGAVLVTWSPATGAGSVTGYDVAPIEHGVPCPSCGGANVVAAGRTSLELGSAGATVTGYAVRSVVAGAESAWVTAARPGSGTPTGVRPATVAPGGGPWVASPVAGEYTSPLDDAPPGWTRTVARDAGFSAPTASDGDLWVFGDTSVIDTPEHAGPATAVDCFTRNGTAGVAPPSLPPNLAEAVQPVGTAQAQGTAQCSGDRPLPAATEEPYQLLGDYPGPVDGSICSNWVNGLTDALAPTGGLSNAVSASYGSNCLSQSNVLVGLGGTWTTGVDVTSPAAQVLSMPLGPASQPDLPPVTCPGSAVTSYDGGPPSSGEYGSLLDDGGYDYLYTPYGNSTNAFAGLGIPESTCSAMGLARVPAATATSSGPADVQYLLPGGEWVTSAQSGIPAATLAAQSADIMPADWNGAYAGQVDVTTLAGGELAMVYELPDPIADPLGGTDVAAVRTATSPAGPWSAPAYFELPGFSWGSDYQIVLHPDLSTPGALALSYVAVSDVGGLTDRQVTFATLDPTGLPTPGTAPATGYLQVAADGGVFAFGSATYSGSMGGRPLDAPIVGMADAPAGGGYWEVASDGGIFTFGDAPYAGSMGGRPLVAPVVGMAVPPTGKGYWEVASDGGVFAFGSAPFYGSMGGRHLVAPIVGLVPGPTGRGYWEVASDGGIFAFGDAPFFGSMGGQPLDAPVVGIAATPDGLGYWEVASDGGIFAFGDAAFYGSMGGRPLDAPVVGLAADPTGGGYWEVASDGGIFAFGDAAFYGSMGGRPLNEPVVAMDVG